MECNERAFIYRQFMIDKSQQMLKKIKKNKYTSIWLFSFFLG